MRAGPAIGPSTWKLASGGGTHMKVQLIRLTELNFCHHLLSVKLIMALPMLINGADCGPSNALQGLTKNLERDRGLQQVCQCAYCGT